MAQPPSFPFYPGDWIAGTSRLSLADKGAYIDALAHQWHANEGLPGDHPVEFAAIVRCTAGEARKVWPRIAHKFTRGADGLYRNARLEEIRAEKEKWHATRKENGAKGGRPRRAPAMVEPITVTTVEPSGLTPAVSSSSSSSSSPTAQAARVPSVVPRRSTYRDPFGMRPDPTAAAHIFGAEGQVIAVPSAWATKARHAYALTADDIDVFATWTSAWVQTNGFEDGGKLFQWLDARLAEWRQSRQQQRASTAAADATKAFIAHQDAIAASIPPRTPEQVLALLRGGRK